MAKRKTPKAEKVIDLTPKAEKITDEELNRLQSVIKTLDYLTMDVGKIEVQKNLLMNSVVEFQTKISELRSEFKNKYSTDNVNIQDGTIGYPEETNQSENGETDKED